MKNFFKNYSGVIGTLVVFAIMLMPVFVTAASVTSPVPGGSDANTLKNPLGDSINTPCKLVLALLRAVTVLGIPIAVLFIVWAGFKFVLARGNPGELTTARRNFLNVLIGIGIFVGATLIANIIVNTLKDLGVQGINSC